MNSDSSENTMLENDNSEKDKNINDKPVKGNI